MISYDYDSVNKTVHISPLGSQLVERRYLGVDLQSRILDEWWVVSLQQRGPDFV